jgi:tetratricopeptide (TPR) repeat protein
LPSATEESFSRAFAALQAGRADDAERLFKKVLRLNPRHVPALNLCSVLLTQLGRFDEAEQYIKRAIQENATSDASFYNYGVILKALKRYDESIEQLDRALAIKGSTPEALNLRGECHLDLKHFDEAISDFDNALAINPNFAGALINKARALADLEQYETGLEITEKALRLQPVNALAWLARGQVLNGLERYDEALEAFGRALTIQPDLAEAWLGRGSSYLNLDRHQEARTAFERLLTIKPDDADAWHGYGDALLELRKLDETKAAYQKALGIKPDHVHAHGSMARLLMELGRIDEANQLFRKAIALKPQIGAFYAGLVATKKFTADDLAAMEALAADKSVKHSARERTVLNFALGGAYADSGNHRRAFEHFLLANAGERARIDYDETKALAHFDHIAEVFTPELIASKSGGGVSTSRPIFIIGMPRSGSTLIEQILASHPAIEGAGEVQALTQALTEARNEMPDPQENQKPYPDFIPFIQQRTIKSFAEKYLALLAELAPQGRERITDKMLGNFLFAGLIHLAFPNAAILHTVRNPVDTCVSIFSLRFKAVIAYAYDLAELGRYYMGYQRLMTHWHNVLPAGRILDVRYEDTVADLEGQARRILSYCGLPWDDRCLSFHKTERPVRTASIAQVRQPIYKSSVERWRVYEEFLGPLLKELGIKSDKSEAAE